MLLPPPVVVEQTFTIYKYFLFKVKRKERYFLRFGGWDLSASGDLELDKRAKKVFQVREIKEIRTHPEYEKSTLNNNLALVKLKAPVVTIPGSVERVKLPGCRNNNMIGRTKSGRASLQRGMQLGVEVSVTQIGKKVNRKKNTIKGKGMRNKARKGKGKGDTKRGRFLPDRSNIFSRGLLSSPMSDPMSSPMWGGPMMGGPMYSGMRRLNHMSPMFPTFVHPFAQMMSQMFNPTATILLPGQLPMMIPLSNLPIKIEFRAPRTTFDEFPDVPDDKDDTIDPAEGNTNDMGPPSFSEKPPSFSEMPPSFSEKPPSFSEKPPSVFEEQPPSEIETISPPDIANETEGETKQEEANPTITEMEPPPDPAAETPAEEEVPPSLGREIRFEFLLYHFLSKWTTLL